MVTTKRNRAKANLKVLLPKFCQRTQLSIGRMGTTDLILGFSAIYQGKTMRCLFNSKNKLPENPASRLLMHV